MELNLDENFTKTEEVLDNGDIIIRILNRNGNAIRSYSVSENASERTILSTKERIEAAYGPRERIEEDDEGVATMYINELVLNEYRVYYSKQALRTAGHDSLAEYVAANDRNVWGLEGEGIIGSVEMESTLDYIDSIHDTVEIEDDD